MFLLGGLALLSVSLEWLSELSAHEVGVCLLVLFEAFQQGANTTDISLALFVLAVEVVELVEALWLASLV